MDIFAVTAAIESLKKVLDVVKKAGQIDLVDIIITTQQQLLEMQSTISTLDANNRDLKEKLKTKGDIFHKQNAYYIRKQDGKEDGPFCTRCWDKNNDTIRLNVFDDTGQCPECKNIYDYGTGSSNTVPGDTRKDTW